MTASGDLARQRGLWGLFERAEREHADRVAVRQAGGELDYAGLGRLTRGLAGALQARDVEPGDRVAILADNGPEFLVAYFAAAAAGATLVPINTRLALSEMTEILGDARPALLLFDEAHAELARELRTSDRAPDALGLGDLEALADAGRTLFEVCSAGESAPAQLYYTSGTTGRAKGVVLTHANVLAHAEQAAAELGLRSDDVWGHFAPMFHLADAWACFAVTATGGVHVFESRFEPARVLATIAREGVRITNLVPTMLVRLLEAARCGVPPHDLRLVLSGGAPIAPEVIDRLVSAFGCAYAQTYGMTETSPYLTLSLPREDERELPADELRRLRARTGRPFGRVVLEVVDEAGRPVPQDDETVGEIRVRGETVTPGYWDRPDATAEAIRDGWLYTGDLAVVDQRGWIDIVDRKKDVILTGGETVYSTEVENALFALPEVVEAAAFGVPDDEWGERVCAAVVLREGARTDADALRGALAGRLARYKLPRSIHFVADLPRTGSGKIAKRALRARW